MLPSSRLKPFSFQGDWMQACIHITDNRRRILGEKIKGIQEHEGL